MLPLKDLNILRSFQSWGVSRRHAVAEALGGKPAGEEGAVASLLWTQPLPRLPACARPPSSLPTFPPTVVPGPGAAAGACHHGAGAPGQCPRHLPPGCHALPSGLLLG